MNTIKLMQPGGYRWTDNASCIGDPRFTQADKPHPKVCERLTEICEECPVLRECFAMHEKPFTIGGDTYEITGVFAAGEWREVDEQDQTVR